MLAAVKTEPKSANFKGLNRSSLAQTTTVTIKRGDAGPISPSLVEKADKNISAQFREITAGEEYALDVTVSPPWPNDLIRGNVSFSTGVPEAPTASIAVYAPLPVRVHTVPKEFRLPEVVEQPTEQSVEFKWGAGPIAKIVEATCNDPALTVRLAEAAGQQRVYLNVPAGYAPARRPVSVTVRTDDQEVPSFQIPVEFGEGKKAGAGGQQQRVDLGQKQAGQRANTRMTATPPTETPAPPAAGGSPPVPPSPSPSAEQQTPPAKGQSNVAPPKDSAPNAPAEGK